MSLVADGLQPFIFPSLLTLSGRAGDQSLVDVLFQTRAGYDLTVDGSDHSTSIDFRESTFVVAAIAGDGARLGLAAFQSAVAAQEGLKESETIAWGLIKLYYAAFYAGHAVLRLLGESCSFLDRRHVERVLQIGNAVGVTFPFRVEAGLYHCQVTSNGAGLKLRKARGGSVGGTHESFWSTYVARIEVIAERIARESGLSTEEARRVILKLEEFKSTTRSVGGAGSWLSTVRNDVQYRHRFGVWQPASVKKGERASLARLVEGWRADPINISPSVPQTGELGQIRIGMCLCRRALPDASITHRREVGRRKAQLGESGTTRVSV